jgi:hypothetical protein
MAIERGLDDPALNAAAAAVDEPHLAQPCLRCRVDEVGDHARNVPRRERMQIQLALDWNPDGVVISHQPSAISRSPSEVSERLAT